MSNVDFKFGLGEVVRDKVTGFTGVVMSQTKYFTGCKHYGLQSKDLTTDGKVREWEYLDESRLEATGEAKVIDEPVKSTSAPGHNPPQM